MGVSYSRTLSTWHYGTTTSATTFQDDIAVIASTINGFGYRPDDHGNTAAAATVLGGATQVQGSGIITQTSDVDVFSFITGTGNVSFEINPAAIGNNLDLIAQLWNASGSLVLEANPGNRYDADFTTFLNAGTYFLHVKNNGQYGRVGQYSFVGNVIAPTVEPTAIALASSTYRVGEDGVSIGDTITLTRSGNLSEAVTVTVQLTNGTAIGGSSPLAADTDFDSQPLSITFAANQTTATLSVPIHDDSLVETNETLTLSLLSGSSNVLIGSQVTATLEIVDNDLPSQPPSPLSLLAPQTFGEVGRVQNYAQTTLGTVQTLNFNQTYINPVVFAGPLTQNGSDPAIVRIADITSRGFSFYLQEPSNLDGIHGAESFSYLVVEAGTWQLSDGTVVEVGALTTDTTVAASSWERINFSSDFSEAPVVLSQVQSDNDPGFVRTRQQSLGSDGFQFALEGQENRRSENRGAETVGWLAVTPGQNEAFLAGKTGNSVTHQWYDVAFPTALTGSAPQLLANLASYNGSDPAGLRYQNLDSNRVRLRADEDTTADREIQHISEIVHYLGFGQVGSLEGTALSTDPLPTSASDVLGLSSTTAAFNSVAAIA
ncbi:MAG: hypothetical protein HC890_14075 [Chloroflexaceae bacterium]|nr:hypothetical protein [Chloroflexaceae bacterium]